MTLDESNLAFVKPKMRVVSNSEINTWRDCQRKYYYSYDKGIEPIDSHKGRALQIGNIGHWTQKRYFEALMEKPGNFQYAREIALQWLAMFIADTNRPTEAEYGNLVFRKLSQYFDHFSTKHPLAVPLQVEKYHQHDLVDEFGYGFTLDLLLQDGPIIYLVDHKWTYDFWSQTKIDTKGAGQISKYFWALKSLGVSVDQVMISELRYRERIKNPMTNEEQFRETSWTPTYDAQRTLMIEQVKTSRQIIEHRKLPLADRERDVTRNIGTSACDFCDFANLCLGELNGEDVSTDIEANFQPKTYDYNKPSEVESVVGAVNLIEERNSIERDY